MRFLLLSCSMLAAMVASAMALAPPQAPTEASPAPQRVIVRVSRDAEVAGHVELEDEHVLVIRTPEGPLREFARTRVLGVVRLVDPEPGQRGVVYLKNGDTRRGVIIKDAFDGVELEIEGIPLRLPRDVVDHVGLDPTFQERYELAKKSIGPATTARHLSLCRWLIDQRRYELARDELEALLAHAEGAPRAQAQALLTMVRAQLEHVPVPEGAAADRPATPAEPAAPGSTPRGSLPASWKLLSDEDVNLIRVYEIDFRNPPKLAVPPETIRKLIDRYGADPLMPASAEQRNALFRADPAEIVELMFQLRARDLYGEVRVLSEPRALNMFRQRVHHTWLMNSCSTTRCHGGTGAGRLQLYRDGYRHDRVWMTNLLTLERLEVDPDWPLINYEDPIRSLIVQYGLPANGARKPHPPVPGWKPVFTRSTQRLLAETLEWIGQMMQPRPDYPVRYELPQTDATMMDERAADGRARGS